jgi:hypothetical protein
MINKDITLYSGKDSNPSKIYSTFLCQKKLLHYSVNLILLLFSHYLRMMNLIKVSLRYSYRSIEPTRGPPRAAM